MTTAGKPIHVTNDNYTAEVMQSDVPVVIDFWAPWCGPCRMIGPVLEELAQEYEGRVKVAKVNVDEEQDLATQFYIRGIPTLVVMVDGTNQGQMVGFRGAQPLHDLFAELSQLATPASVQDLA